MAQMNFPTLMATAAAQAGSQFGGEGQLGMVMRNLAQRNQMSEMQDQEQAQQNQEAMKLQLAGQLQQQRQQGSPTSQLNFRSSGGPLADSLRQAKQLTRSTILGDTDLSPDQQSQFQSLENDPNIQLKDYEGLVRNAADQHNKLQQQQLGQDKLEQAKSSAVAREAEQTQKSQQVETDKQNAAQRQELAPQMKGIEKDLDQSGFDPNGPPTQFNPTQTVTQPSIFGGLSDMMMQGITGGGASDPSVAVKGGDPAAMQKMIQLQKMRNRMQGLQPGQAAPAPQQQQVAHVTNPADYAQIPPGTPYIDPDGHLRMKPHGQQSLGQ